MSEESERGKRQDLNSAVDFRRTFEDPCESLTGARTPHSFDEWSNPARLWREIRCSVQWGGSSNQRLLPTLLHLVGVSGRGWEEDLIGVAWSP